MLPPRPLQVEGFFSFVLFPLYTAPRIVDAARNRLLGGVNYRRIGVFKISNRPVQGDFFQGGVQGNQLMCCVRREYSHISSILWDRSNVSNRTRNPVIFRQDSIPQVPLHQHSSSYGMLRYLFRPHHRAAPVRTHLCATVTMLFFEEYLGTEKESFAS